MGYSTADHQNHITKFKSRWSELYGQNHEDALAACLMVFVGEYNEESTDALESLERWIEEHDAELEATKPTAR